MKLFTAVPLGLFFSFIHAQSDGLVQINATVPTTCTMGFQPGQDTVIFRTPYTYAQVISIIGSYKNLTWSGNPDNTVKLNGTDNTVGTAREYTLMGIHLIETILAYSKPPGGPYYENHNTALLTIPAANNVRAYLPYDATNVTSICSGMASEFNFTAHFCASDAMVAQQTLHQVHLMDGQTVGKLLGGMNFTSCDALMSMQASAGSLGVDRLVMFAGLTLATIVLAVF